MFTPVRTLMLAAALFTGATVVAINLDSTEAPAETTYVGQETCMEAGCHEGPTGDGSIYAGAEPFLNTMHQKIHLRPSPETVRIDRYFEEGRILVDPKAKVGTVEDTMFVHLSKSEDKTEYFVQMWFARGDSTPKMKVAYTYGGNGWIQRYLLEHNGHYYVTPFQYVLPAYKDYSDTGNTIIFLDHRKWAVDDPNVDPPLLRWFDMNSAKFRLESWDYCAFCHVNGFGVTSEKINDTTVHSVSWFGKGVDSASQDINISIGCETCHGPGSEHSANPTASNIVSPGRWPTDTREGFQLRLDLCGQCHNRPASTDKTFKFPYDDKNDRPFIPGVTLKDYISKGDYQVGANIWPDSSEYAHHQHGQDFMRSYGYKDHTIYKGGCWSCHTVHYNKIDEKTGKELPFQLDRDWYSLKDGEGCVSCHGSAGELFNPPLEDLTKTTTWNGRTVNAHTKHSMEASQCVNCHFTKTASITFVDLQTKPLYDFTSHHFFVIRPNLTRELKDKPSIISPGQINTCAEACHRNGRGSRNFNPDDPIAPDFGITDSYIQLWREKSDLDLADTLWKYYQEMYSGIMSADREAGPVTGKTVLTSVMPNPMMHTTSIRFNIANAGKITLNVYDTKGALVRQLASTRHEAGNYSVIWDGLNDMRQPVSAGSYIVRLKTSSGISSMNVVVVR